MTKKLTFCAMLSVMGALSLLLTNIFQTTTLFFFLFSTLFCYIATVEHGVRYGLMTCATVTLLGFLLVGNKVSMAAYAIMVSHYPIVKYIIDHKIYRKSLRWLAKICWVTLLSFAAYLILKQFLVMDAALWLLYLLGLLSFVLYDIALEKGILFYAVRLRK
ncbi:MAG: hypothetical protein IJ278_04465 [Clostridia bacterium]|nr:hypothetical protein [Clostridia bacterium]